MRKLLAIAILIGFIAPASAGGFIDNSGLRRKQELVDQANQRNDRSMQEAQRRAAKAQIAAKCGMIGRVSWMLAKAGC